MAIKLPISVIIPARNEAERLPALLESILKQKYIPEEIIVADAFSTDETRNIANSYNVIVVDGGPVSVGRNNGAKAAKTDLFIFIDADSIVPGDVFFKKLYDDFKKQNLDVGSILFRIDDVSKKYFSARLFMNSFFLLKSISSLSPIPFIEGPGFLIATRSAFEKIGGFFVLKDGVPEDLYFMVSGIKLGLKYKVLKHRFIASGRRFHTMWQSIKALVGIVLGSMLLKTGLYKHKKLVDFSTGLYGEMGGEAEKRQRLKKAITIGTITLAIPVGMSLLVSFLKNTVKKKK